MRYWWSLVNLAMVLNCVVFMRGALLHPERTLSQASLVFFATAAVVYMIFSLGVIIHLLMELREEMRKQHPQSLERKSGGRGRNVVKPDRDQQN